MNKAFLCTRVKYDAKTKKGGICSVLYTFYGEKVLHQSEVNYTKEDLKLLGLALALESLAGHAPMALQIDAKLNADSMQQINTGVLNTDSEEPNLIVRVRNAMKPFYCTFKKGRYNAAIAMMDKAEFYAAANVGVGYIPGNETPIIISGPVATE